MWSSSKFHNLVLLDGLCKYGQFDVALELIQAMQNSELEPYIVHYNILLDGIIEAGCFEVVFSNLCHWFKA